MQAQTWKNNTQGTAFLIFARCTERLLQFEKAISRVICQTSVFMQLRAGWELDEWDGMMRPFLVLYGPEEKMVQIKNKSNLCSLCPRRGQNHILWNKSRTIRAYKCPVTKSKTSANLQYMRPFTTDMCNE